MSDPSNPLKSYLWTHRKRMGYTQQDVARLLGCASSNQISRYERGSVPSLKAAIGFEILYEAPICDLFSGLYDSVQTAIKRQQDHFGISRKKDDERIGLPKLLPLPKRNSPIILAIDPHSRHFGVAVLEGSSLIYWAVKEVGRKKRPQRLVATGQRIVIGLIDKYHPKVLVVGKPDLARSRETGPLLKRFCAEIFSLCEARKISVYEYALDDVKKFFAGNWKITKREVALAIARWYPELRSKLPKARKPGDPEDRRQRIFDAIALGLTYLYKTLSTTKEPFLYLLRIPSILGSQNTAPKEILSY
jgi:Holliday junction resolvasome RuvABC endonuclease subunit/DNA-binding XRE family transcriptional regulator